MEALILSHAQDTNGQNARFGAAARRWGHDKNVIRALAIGNDDPGGVVGRFAIAAEKLGGLSIRSAARVSHYFDWPPDIVWDRSTEPLVRELIQRADVIHLNNSYRPVQRYHVRKPMLLHHHGSMFRRDPQHMLSVARARRWVQAVSTIDLTRPDPEVLHWLPTAYDIDGLAAIREANRREPDGRFRIVTAPTDRAKKATEALIIACDVLAAEGVPVDLVIVEGRTNREALIEKAKADILFDQTLYGYGCNAVEAWGMGLPVIAGADDWTLEAMKREYGRLPFIVATEATIADVLRKVYRSRTMHATWAGRGLEHVRKYHDERPALARLAELYALAIKANARPVRAADAVRFRNTGNPVYVDNLELVGDIETTDPVVISRLRYLASRPRRFSIVELTEERAG